MSGTADRFNEGKPQLSFVLDARYALEGVAAVLEFGAKKYSRGNWKKGLDKHQIVDSLLRHLTKYVGGEDVDDESGCHHLDHVLANALFLADQENGRRPEQASNNNVEPPVYALETNPKEPLPKHLRGYEKSLDGYSYENITAHWCVAPTYPELRCLSEDETIPIELPKGRPLPDYMRGYQTSTVDLARYNSRVAANHATLQDKPITPIFNPAPGVGKRVRLTEYAQFNRVFHRGNRIDLEGVVEEFIPYNRFPWTVRWDDGETGLYQTQDLEVIDS